MIESKFEHYIKRHQAGTFFQSLAFAQFQEKISYRGKSWQLSAGAEMPNSEMTAACSVVKMLLPMGFSWLWVPYGPLVAEGANEKEIEKIFHELEKIAHKEKALFVRIEPPLGWAKNKSFGKWQIKKSRERFTPEHSLEINLEQSEEEILAQMKPKGRYNIACAKRHKVLVQQYKNPEKIPPRDFEQFYALLKNTAARDGFGVHPKYFYETLTEIFGQHNSVSLFLAYVGEKVIAGEIVMYYKDTATYYYGASSYEHRKFMAPYLVQWEAIREAKHRGMKTYDFLGIAPAGDAKHVWSGITDFKKKFGGEEVTYPSAFDIIYKPVHYTLLNIFKKFR